MCQIIALPLSGPHVWAKDWEKGLNRQIMGPLILQREGCHLGAAVVYILREGRKKTVVNCGKCGGKKWEPWKSCLVKIEIYIAAGSEEFNLIRNIVLINTRTLKMRYRIYSMVMHWTVFFSHWWITFWCHFFCSDHCSILLEGEGQR